MRLLSSHRSGVTFIELLMFLSVLSIVCAVILPLLFAATENRLLQESISIVEHTGTQMLESFDADVRHAQKILDPTTGGQGTVLALQTDSAETSPTIFGVGSGSLFVIRGTNKIILSSPQVAVSNFRVRNTSTSSTSQSVQISFTLSRTIRLEAPHMYSQNFKTLIPLYRDDAPASIGCSCTVPGCIDSNNYAWQVCMSGVCQNATDQMKCE
jgi:type II secretory pathway pseudopilin PulG